MNFSVLVIARNEVKTLPRLLQSLQTFMQFGGDVVVVDTGSTDGTPDAARAFNCRVFEEGNRFLKTINQPLAAQINRRFVVPSEAPVVQPDDKLFDFAAARNYAALQAKHDMVSWADADEVFTRLDLDKINARIAAGVEAFRYNFVFSHDQFGNPAIKFIQSKFYDRRKQQWVGIVHEVLQGEARIEDLPEDIFLLEHWQNVETNRSGYLKGLALDCFLNPTKDRQSHYLGREMVWMGRPKSAIKELTRHIEMNGWPAERAQSMIFIGDAWGLLNKPNLQVEWYNKAFYHDCTRREALIKLACFYRHNNNPQATAVYAAAALQIPWNGFYANEWSHYHNLPHELLYWAKGWMGDIAGAQEHLLKAMSWAPFHPAYLRDTKYYFEYPDQGIDGWMRFEELQWLYNTAKTMHTVCELGSWKGRSTHALCSGCKDGKVTAVDHFMGSEGEDAQHWEAKQGDAVYKQFLANTKDLKNLSVRRSSTLEAADQVPKGYQFDMVFIDAAHTYEGVKADIQAWKPMARILLCGHDYCPQWPGVVKAVDETLGPPDGVAGTIWYKWMTRPMVSIVIPTLGREEKLKRLLQAIKDNADYGNYEVIVKQDHFPPLNLGVPKMLKMGVEESHGDLVMYLGNDCIPKPGFLREAVFTMIREFPDLDGLVGLNDGYWEGEFATHWLASKKLLPLLDGEFFNTEYFHTGCDNELTERCRKAGKYVWAPQAEVFHDHPVQKGFHDEDMDDVYRLAYRADHHQHDLDLLARRSVELGLRFKAFCKPPRIPRRIFTIWLSEGPLPTKISSYIASQHIKGWEHRLITLENCPRGIPYVDAAIEAHKWVKAADYLRLWLLYNEGGVYLDADMEVLQDFDDLREHGMFVCVEPNRFVANSVIGSAKEHPTLARAMETMDKEFKGDDDLVFESGMETWTKTVYASSNQDIKLLPADFFFPYNHQTGETKITNNTRTIHHYMKSWKPAGQ